MKRKHEEEREKSKEESENMFSFSLHAFSFPLVQQHPCAQGFGAFKGGVQAQEL